MLSVFVNLVFFVLIILALLILKFFSSYETYFSVYATKIALLSSSFIFFCLLWALFKFITFWDKISERIKPRTDIFSTVSDNEFVSFLLQEIFFGFYLAFP